MSHIALENNVRDDDREFFARELDSFVPDRVYDAHAHIWNSDHGEQVVWEKGFPSDVGLDEYRQFIDVLHPSRPVSALFLSIPFDKDRRHETNEWVAKNVAQDPTCRGHFFIEPDDDPDWVRQEVRRLGLHGLKCYHLYADMSPTWEAEIPSYLPERLVKIAGDEGWTITLHMVKSRCVADPGNLHWIRHYCETYPNMKLILAHSARGFQPSHNIEGLPKLQGLDNLYFDTSSNCEPHAHEAIIRFFGHERLMYGSDFYLSHLRGRTFGANDSFVWAEENASIWNQKQLAFVPSLIGLEHLRSLKLACWSARLSDSAIEDIFWNNAARLFGVQ